MERKNLNPKQVDQLLQAASKKLGVPPEQLKSELETAKKNLDNKQRSTGSQKSAGNAQKKADPIDDDWYYGDD